jgi:hypothetical protein
MARRVDDADSKIAPNMGKGGGLAERRIYRSSVANQVANGGSGVMTSTNVAMKRNLDARRRPVTFAPQAGLPWDYDRTDKPQTRLEPTPKG